jgi:hypothetical protein
MTELETMIGLLVKSRFSYNPTYDEWVLFWRLLKQEPQLLDSTYINELFGLWYADKPMSPRQKYFLFKKVFPDCKIGAPPPKKNQPSLKDFVNDPKEST